MNLQIRWRTSPLFSHPYKTLGVSPIQRSRASDVQTFRHSDFQTTHPAIIHNSTSRIGASCMRTCFLALALSLVIAATLQVAAAQSPALDAKVDQELPSLVSTYKT